MTSPHSRDYSSEEEPEERMPSPVTQSSTPVRSQSVGAKRRRLEVGETSRGRHEPTPTPATVTTPSPWAWYPELVGNWITQGQVPSPYPSDSITAVRLPPLDHPMEQVIAAVVGRTNRELGQLRQACGTLVHELRRAESRIAYLMNLTERLDRSQEATRDRNRELTDEVLHLRAQIARVNPPPFGMGNRELSDRLDMLEHRHTTFAGAAEGRLDDIEARLSILNIRVEVLEEDAQAAQMMAMVNPPPEDEEEGGDDIDEDDDDDAQSDISDAMEP